MPDICSYCGRDRATVNPFSCPFCYMWWADQPERNEPKPLRPWRYLKFYQCARCRVNDMCATLDSVWWYCPACRKSIDAFPEVELQKTTGQGDVQKAETTRLPTQAKPTKLAKSRYHFRPSKELSCDWRLAARIVDRLESSNRKIGLRHLKQRMRATRYPEFNQVLNWFLSDGVIRFDRVGRKTYITLLRRPAELFPVPKIKRRRPRRPRSEWFEELLRQRG